MLNTTPAAQNLVASCKGATVSTEQLDAATKQATLSTKALNLSMEALRLAGNMLLSMGISLAIQAVIKGIDNLVHAQEKAIDASNEAISQINEQRKALSDNKKTIDDVSSDYERLSKGVDDFGRNVSLNTEEYARYNDIVNQIAEMFPQMVKGYTDEGNAILSHKGSVEALTEAYKEQKRAAQDAIITNAGTVYEGYTAKVDHHASMPWEETGLIQQKGAIETVLREIAEGNKRDGSTLYDMVSFTYGNTAMKDIFDKAGLDTGIGGRNTRNIDYIRSHQKELSAALRQIVNELNAETAKITPILQAYLDDDYTYATFDDKTRSIVQKIVSSFDSEFYGQFETGVDMFAWVKTNVLDKIGDDSDMHRQLELSFDLQTKLNDDSISIGEYEEQVQPILNSISELPDEVQKAIKVMLGIQTDGNLDFNSYKDSVSKKLKDEDKEKVKGLTKDELKIASEQIKVDEGTLLSYDELLARIRAVQKEIVKTNTNSLDKFKSATSSIASLQKAFGELSDEGYLTIDTISNIQEAVGESVDNWDEYQNKLMNAKVGSDEFNQVLSELTYAMLENELGVEGLANADEAYVARILQENGILNANEVAHIAVTQAKIQHKLASYDGTDASYEEAAALINECGSADLAREAMAQLEIAKLLMNDAHIQTSADIEALLSLAETANMTAQSIADLARAKVELADGFVGPISAGTKSLLEGSYKPTYNKLNPNDYRVSAPQYAPKGSGKSGSSKQDDATKKELEALQKSLEMRQKIIEKYKDAIDLTDFGLDVADENDFALKADLLNNKLSQVTSYGEAMRQEFERIANTVPQTADEADALASRLESLGNDMRSNIKTLRDTKIELQKLKIDSIVSVGKDYTKDLENELDAIERRIERLNRDNNEDYKYVNQILDMQTLLPTRSSLNSLAKSRSSADRDIIQSEQKTQDTLNDILETQIKKNEQLREDERQALLSQMDTMRSETALKFEQSSTDYVAHGKSLVATTNSYTQEIANLISNMNLTIPEPDISQVKKACDEVNRLIESLGITGGGAIKYERGARTDGKDGGDLSALVNANKPTIIKNVADGQLGTPYVWGGIQPSGYGAKNGALDCSGFTRYVYRAIGIELPRVADDQLKSGIGTLVDWNHLKQGDQLFFGNGTEATHTGIYVGNGQMIHAPRTGDVVKYAPIAGRESSFMGARRYALGRAASSSSEVALVGDDKKGRLNQIRPEMIVGKQDVQIAGLHGAEFVNLQKGDQVIPYEKTKEILKRSGRPLPRFASGTIDPMDIAAYIRQKYPEITNAGIAAILGNIEQESGFNPKALTREAYGSGSNRQVNRLGLFQLDDERIANWSNIVNHGTWQEQIDTALAEGRYANSGKGSLRKYNVWDNVLTNPSLDASEAARQFDRLYERSDGNSREKRAQNAEKYLQQLSASKANDIQQYKDTVLDEIDRATVHGRAAQLALLSDDSISDIDKQLASLNIYKPLAEKAQQQSAEAYKVLLDEYLGYLQKVEDGTEQYSQEIVDAYTDGFSEILDVATSYADKVVEFKNTLREYADKQMSELDDYISERNTYNDWGKYNDSEMSVINKKIGIIVDLCRAGVISQKEATKEISALRQDQYQQGLDRLNAAIDRAISDRERIDEKRKERLNLQSSRYSARETGLHSYYDVINSVADALHEINKELSASKAMYEYINEDTRKLLFNQEDYNELASELNRIQAKANMLRAEYENDISKATADNMEEITAEYQRQNNALMKQYEILKANLEVAKKRQQLDNVLAERNVRMFINGEWQWVANTQDVINAQNELADAEYNRDTAKTSAEQQSNVDTLQRAQDQIATQVNIIDSTLSQIRERWENIQLYMEGSGESIANVLQDFANSDVPELRNIVSTLGVAFSTLTESITGQAIPSIYYADDYLSKTLSNAQSLGEAVTLNKQRNRKIDAMGLNERKFTDIEIEQLWNYARDKDNIKIDADKDYLAAILNASSEYEVIKFNIERNQKITTAQPGEASFGQLQYSPEEALSLWRDQTLAVDLAKNNLTDSLEFWNEAQEITKSEQDDINANLLTLIENTIPSLKAVLENSGDMLIGWVRYVVSQQISAQQSVTPSSSSEHHYASGTRYTAPGMAELGEDAWELFFSKHGQFTPITQPTLANLDAGGIVFNQAQMNNLRNLWDLASSRKMPNATVMKAATPTTIDHSHSNNITINGMTVDTGSRDGQALLSALRRYVSNH